jgi:transcriptional regulator
MLVAEEAVEIRVLRRQGKSIREIARMLGGVAQYGAALFARRRAAWLRA